LAERSYFRHALDFPLSAFTLQKSAKTLPTSIQAIRLTIILIALSDVTVHYIRGLPNVICPLPSRNEKCQFILRPVSHNVGDFIDMLKAEDRGIDRAAISNKDGVRIASSCSIENLMDENFW
jgi:hypothetical protein